MWDLVSAKRRWCSTSQAQYAPKAKASVAITAKKYAARLWFVTCSKNDAENRAMAIKRPPHPSFPAVLKNNQTLLHIPQMVAEAALYSQKTLIWAVFAVATCPPDTVL